jgi:CubicO group peptidase (beta-lactamase class C family)
MRLGRFVVAGLLAALVACTAPSGTEPPPNRVCRGSTCIDPAMVASRLREQLDGQVAGYVALVGDAPVVAGGAARRDGDPPALPMAADVMVNTASVGKMFTTVVLLEALARHGLDVGSPIAPYLPPDWAHGPNVETITFGNLLTHRSGFRLDSGRIFSSEAAAQEQIAQGVTNTEHGTAEYNNINFSIVRDLLPQLEHADGSADALFLERVQHDVFDPIGVRTARCAAPAQPMLFYPPVTAAPGPGRTPPVGPSACSSGGWFMTPADMLRVLRGLENGDLLTEGLRRQINDGCLGWDVCSRDGSHWKGGAFGDAEGAAFETYFGTSNGLPMVVAINSPAPSAPLPTIVRNAEIAATMPR